MYIWIFKIKTHLLLQLDLYVALKPETNKQKHKCNLQILKSIYNLIQSSCALPCIHTFYLLTAKWSSRHKKEMFESLLSCLENNTK